MRYLRWLRDRCQIIRHKSRDSIGLYIWMTPWSWVIHEAQFYWIWFYVVKLRRWYYAREKAAEAKDR